MIINRAVPSMGFLRRAILPAKEGRIMVRWLNTSPTCRMLYADVLEGVLAGQRASLARAITLVESENPSHREMAQHLVAECIRRNQSAEIPNIRIGITGPPGAGKSSFIEVFGQYLIAEFGKRVSVLTVDPSSCRTGGSLLGDKTRMHHLSKNPHAYIRSSPTGGLLGGVCKSTADCIEVVQAAGYDVTLIETVGVGQAEFKIQDMCDCLILLIPPGGGDELQAVKKGIVEVIDVICVTKADGQLLPEARRVASEYVSALKFVRPKLIQWRPRVILVSSRTSTGLDKLWSTITEFMTSVGRNDIVNRRVRQRVSNMWTYVQEDFLHLARRQCASVQQDVERGVLTPGQASHKLLHTLCGEAMSKNVNKTSSGSDTSKNTNSTNDTKNTDNSVSSSINSDTKSSILADKH